jgi:hypothetical protein
MRRFWLVLFLSSLPLLAQESTGEETAATPPLEVTEPTVLAPLASAYAEATVATAKTSIYIGAVTLKMPPFVREGDTYRSTYAAKVFPLFFYNESGRIAITLTDQNLRQLAAGERVYFKGEAFSSEEEPRRVEGQADPADAMSGKIKVRVWVSKNIELIFNTTYQFTGNPTTSDSALID